MEAKFKKILTIIGFMISSSVFAEATKWELTIINRSGNAIRISPIKTASVVSSKPDQTGYSTSLGEVKCFERPDWSAGLYGVIKGEETKASQIIIPGNSTNFIIKEYIDNDKCSRKSDDTARAIFGVLTLGTSEILEATIDGNISKSFTFYLYDKNRYTPITLNSFYSAGMYSDTRKINDIYIENTEAKYLSLENDKVKVSLIFNPDSTMTAIYNSREYPIPLVFNN
ncbi:MAG: hypothetical protein K0R49_306 [Burkholderiales bacterium]|jgi:hypothetical protein|nr:hypothetical protein [Burkholderiales bacterium]